MKALCFFFVLSLAFLLVQCTDPPVSPVIGESEALFAGGNGNGGGGGGGGHTETQGNNLSFPALLADGFAVTPITQTLFSVIYEGPYTGLTQEEIDWLAANGPWYAQKVEGNVWQADYTSVTAADVYFVDWGDAMESTDPKINRPYRLELALYADITSAPMTAYTMAELAFPSSSQETQGTNTTTYESIYSTIATPKGKLCVQKYEGDAAYLTWNSTLGQWVGDGVNVTAFTPENVTFAQELNVGGKYIFGASNKGWKPTEFAEFRVTFYFEANTIVSLATALPGNYNGGAPVIGVPAENNTAVVDATNNITYMDVTVVASGGGGGGGH
jgi:hypothetical protein